MFIVTRETWLTWLGWLLTALGSAFIIGLLYVQSAEEARRSLINAETFCPEPEGKDVWGISRIEPPPAPGGIAIVIDATDSLDGKARAALRSYFGGEEYINSLDDFQRVRVYALEETLGALEIPSFDLCVPPNKTVSPWIDNPRKRREEFKEKFVSVLVGIIDELAQREEAQQSPIMGMLGAVAEDNGRVIVVSDMMEHSPPVCSLYKAAGRQHNYAEFAEKGCAQSADKLSGTHFDILYVKREKLRGLQNPSLLSFWKAHFKENGATATPRPLAVVAISCDDTDDPLGCRACLEPDWLENYEYCTSF